MNDMTGWLIGLAFYAPIHYLGPALVVLLTGSADQQARKLRFKTAIVECTVSMLLAFGLAVWLFDAHPTWAVAALTTAMLIPYLHLYLTRNRLSIDPSDTG
jgi:hypothetical protein